jgi:hypothetical protein
LFRIQILFLFAAQVTVEFFGGGFAVYSKSQTR